MKVGGRPPRTRAGALRAAPVSAPREPVSDARAAKAVASVSAGDAVSILGIPEAELTVRVRAALQTLLAELDTLRRALAGTRARIDELERLADQDTLVPLPNRRGFVREMHRVFSYARRYGVPASLIYFDLNGFKAINDRFGHAAGDEALLQVGRTLLAQVRESDIVGRIGGDEFAVILLQTGQGVAAEKAAALAAAIQAEPLVWEGERIPLSLAFGVCSLGAVEPAEAMAEADRAMYRHKRSFKAGA